MSNELQDKIIICKDCGQGFFFTVGEQKFYKNNNLTEPRRCESCRNLRKQKMEGDKNG